MLGIMNRKDYRELVEFVGERFNKVIDLVVGMSTRIDHLEENMDTKADKADIDRVLSAVDTYAHKADAYLQEHKLLSGQVRRHEGWITKMAKKTNIKLDY